MALVHSSFVSDTFLTSLFCAIMWYNKNIENICKSTVESLNPFKFRFLIEALFENCLTPINKTTLPPNPKSRIHPIFYSNNSKNTPTGASTNPKNFDLNKNLNMNLIWIETWNWKFKLDNWKLKLETWNWKLKIETETWNWNLKLKLEIEIWNWNLKLKFEIDIWIWNLQLNLEI